MSVSVGIRTDLNKNVALHSTVSAPTTAQVTGLSGGLLTLTFEESGADSFSVTSDLITQTITGDQIVAFNVQATNNNPDWGTVIDTVVVGVSAPTGEYYSTVQSLTSVGIWATKAEHSRIYVNGDAF